MGAGAWLEVIAVSRGVALLASTAVVALGSIAIGCGGDDNGNGNGNGSSAEQSAEQKVDSAVHSCHQDAEQLPGAAGSAAKAACTTVGDTTKSDLKDAGGDVNKALSEASSSCKQEAQKLPAGQARSTVSSLCDSIADAG